MTAEIQATLDQLNAQYRASGTTWGYDDAKGAYYSMEANGTRRYQAGTGMPGDRTQKPAGGGGLVHGPMVWDQKTGRWVSKLDANKILGLGIGAVEGAGALNAAFGGASALPAAGTGAIPSSAIPAGITTGAVAPVTMSAADALAGASPFLTSSAIAAPITTGAVAPAMTTAESALADAPMLGNVSTAPNVWRGGAQSPVQQTANAAMSGFDVAAFLKKAGPALASLIPMLATSGSGNLSNPSDLLKQNPQLVSLLDMSVQRAQRTDPLHQAITQLAMSRLPTNMQR